MSSASTYRDDGPLVTAVTRLLPTGTGHQGERPAGWLVPPVLRATEYAFLSLLGLASAGGRASPALVFALLGALAYHHYDVVYRARQGAAPAARWLSRAGLGWDGRMLVVAGAGVADAVPQVYAVLTPALWILFVSESVHSWTRSSPSGAVGVEVDE